MDGDLPRAARTRAVMAVTAATLVIALSFGLNTPLLPALVEAVAPALDAPGVARHAGLLAGVFALGLGAAAPLFGTLSDHVGRRPVLLLGMAGFATAMAAFSRPGDLAALYAAQLLTGLGAAAVMPVASAVIGDLAPDDHWRASRLAWLNMAVVAGFVLGPLAGSAAPRLLIPTSGGPLVAPFLAAAVVSAPAAVFLWRASPPGRRSAAASGRAAEDVVWPLLLLTFAVSAGIGVFEVAIAVRGGRVLDFGPAETAALFMGCSVAMFAAQAAVFAPWIKPPATRWLLGPAFAGLASGLALAGLASSFGGYAAAVGVFAVSGGILVPVLAYWVSRQAGRAQGARLGRQTAAAGLGQALGSAAAGVMFGSSLPSGAPLWIAAAAAALTSFLALGASLRLARPRDIR